MTQHELTLSMDACTSIRDAALMERIILLEAGLGSDHAACIDLDRTASDWQRNWEWYHQRFIAAQQQGPV